MIVIGSHFADPITGYACTVTAVTSDTVTARFDFCVDGKVVVMLSRPAADGLFADGANATPSAIIPPFCTIDTTP